MGLLDNIDPMSLLMSGTTMMANSKGRNYRNAIPMGLEQLAQYQLLAQKQLQEEEDRKQKQAQFEANMELHKLQLEQSKKKKPIVVGKSLIDPDTYQAVYTAPQTEDAPEYGMSPRIATNPKSNQPEYVVFGKDGSTKWTGITPTKDQIEIQKQIDAGVLPPDYAGGIAPQAATNIPGIPQSNMGFTWSGPTATDAKEGTSPNMQLRPILSPKGRRDVNEAVAKESAIAPIKTKQAADEAAAKIISTNQANAQVELPQAKYSSESTIKLVDDMLSHPGIKSAVGFSSYNPLNRVAGTEGNDFNIMLDQLKGKQFMEAYQTLKGGGQITEAEGKKATDAISRMNVAASETAFVKAAEDFKDAVRAGYAKLQQKAGQSVGGAARRYNPKTGKIE